MTTTQIQLIKKSWKYLQQVKPEIIGDVFYSKLFADTPSLRKMFPKDMDSQYRKLIDMLNIIITRLERLDELSGEIAAMATRHAGYGARPAHYKMVGRALLWTLEKGLGNDFTAEVKQAWAQCYTTMADAMICGADESVVK